MNINIMLKIQIFSQIVFSSHNRRLKYVIENNHQCRDVARVLHVEGANDILGEAIIVHQLLIIFRAKHVKFFHSTFFFMKFGT